MTDILLRLERGPDDQPVGQLRAGTGQFVGFTGWLDLIRLLEDALPASGRQRTGPEDGAPTGGSAGGAGPAPGP